MPLDRLNEVLRTEIAGMQEKGTLKGEEAVVTGITRAAGENGPRFHLEGHGEMAFIKMNSNAYLGMTLREELIEAEEDAARTFGVGPGAVRFISGTFGPHVALENRLASFHGREAAMIFSSAYATVMGVLSSLVSPKTAVLSDSLNHNCIINAMRLARPVEKKVYPHLDMEALKAGLEELVGRVRRAIIVTDGIFSMRGDHAPLDVIAGLAREYDARFPENVVLMVDDSHGVGAIGATGRGTEEHTGATGVDVLVATLGKALGVNGGYVTCDATTVSYLREKAAFYIYSNPITPSEAAASLKALEILDSARGRELLSHLRARTDRFRQGLVDLGYETVVGDHPVVPLMVRDTQETGRLVAHLATSGVLATGLSYPVVPRGDEEIRFQISADHTDADIDAVLAVLADFSER
ncbi:MAG: aminotransferase class I/II-fold pyridoxal phosphate-dependent enzyme [Acidobacteriota bacterium]